MAKKTWPDKINWEKVFYRFGLVFTFLCYFVIIQPYSFSYYDHWNVYHGAYIGTYASVFVLLFSTSLLFRAVKSDNLSRIALYFLAIVYLILNIFLFIHVKGHAKYNSCFMANYSYPGTPLYSKCMGRSFTPAIHLKGLFFCGEGSKQSCYTKEQLEDILNSNN